MGDPRDRLAKLAGILPVYTDSTGRKRVITAETQAALLAAMGLPTDGAEAREALDALQEASRTRRLPRWHVCTAGAHPELTPGAPWQLRFETGEMQEGEGLLPALPLGIHELAVAGESCWLLSAPETLPLPPKCWGLMVPLAGLRDAATGGVGDYADLGRFGAALAGKGASFVGVNPIHAGFPDASDGHSPYSPSHRRRLNILHVPTRDDEAGTSPLIDYSAEFRRKQAELRAEFDVRDEDPAFRDWRASEGEALDRFALHQALSARHGPYWHDWPAQLHDPDSDRCRALVRELQDEIRFHAWCQWRAETSLTAAQEAMRRAGAPIGLYLDLAVGTHPSGAETWEDRGTFASGASLGAPPDAFSPDGQNWGLAPFNPHRLVETGFAALAETLRRQLAFSGALRIDHILGFERTFWVPDGGLPGGYVKMPRDAMLAVARIEAARAGAVIVGEDLGNVPKGLRSALKSSGILGCRVAIFEQMAGEKPRFRPARAYPAATIASFSTHDLPNWAGWRQGRDIEARREIREMDDSTAREALAHRAAEVAAFDALLGETAETETDPTPAHRFLARTPSRLVALQAENVLELIDQPNLPGTVDSYPNWRQRLPVSPDRFLGDPRLDRAARTMREAGRDARSHSTGKEAS